MISSKHSIRTIMAVLYVGTFLFRLASGAAMLMTILILHALEFELIEIVIFSISFSLVEGLLAGVAGYLTDAFDARAVLVSASIIAGISKILFFIPGVLFLHINRFLAFIWFCFCHALAGIASSLKVTPTAAIIARYSKYSERGMRMGLWDFVILFGRVIGFAISGVFFTLFGEENALFGLFILGLILLSTGPIFLYFLPRIPPVKETKQIMDEAVSHIGYGIVVMFKSKIRRDLAKLWVSFSALWGLAAVFGALIFSSEIGLTEAETSYVEAILLFVLGGAGPVWGFVADRIGRKPTAVVGILGLIATIFLGAFALSIGISTSSIYFWLIIMPGIFMISAITPSLLARLADTAIYSESGVIMSGFQFVTSMGEILGIITGFVGYTLAKRLLSSIIGIWAGPAGVGLVALFWFLMTIYSGFTLRSDVELRKLITEEISKG